MFARARRRLTLLYIALFGLVLGTFSVAFYVGFTTVLVPSFDAEADLSGEQAAERAYNATIQQVSIALVAADLVIVALVGIAAWLLATRTLRPIREAHERQRRFVADASHEMRTPLAAIRASAEGALAGDASIIEYRRSLETIAASTERLSRLTNDLLLLARTDERLLTTQPEPFDLSVVVAEAIEAFMLAHPACAAPRLALAPDLTVRADAAEVARIVGNLVDNAYRYGGQANRVRVTTRGSERDAVLEVRDDGPGIGEADRERIFEPFYRVNADAASPDGSGLGLAIARSLARRNGGSLSVASQPGAGSTFRLALARSR